MTEPRLGAHIEIVEPYTERGGSDVGALPCIKPTVVRVNGVDVGLIQTDGVEVSTPGDKDAVTVTLTLLPRSVTIQAE
jgi:hypothetical protein